jgi:hypothetical protein
VCELGKYGDDFIREHSEAASKGDASKKQQSARKKKNKRATLAEPKKEHSIEMTVKPTSIKGVRIHTLTHNTL